MVSKTSIGGTSTQSDYYPSSNNYSTESIVVDGSSLTFNIPDTANFSCPDQASSGNQFVDRNLQSVKFTR